MAKVSTLAGVAIIIVVVGLGIGLTGNWGMFVHIPSAVFLAGVWVGGMLLSYRPSSILQAFRTSVRRQALSDPVKLARHIAVFNRAHQLAWAGGLFGTIIGLLQMLASIEDPSSIGVGAAVALLTTVYGIFLAEMIISPLKNMLIADSGEAYAQSDARCTRIDRVTVGFVLIECLLSLAAVGLIVLTFFDL